MIHSPAELYLFFSKVIGDRSPEKTLASYLQYLSWFKRSIIRLWSLTAHEAIILQDINLLLHLTCYLMNEV